jgi:hypothetical protein
MTKCKDLRSERDFLGSGGNEEKKSVADDTESLLHDSGCVGTKSERKSEWKVWRRRTQSERRRRQEEEKKARSGFPATDGIDS